MTDESWIVAASWSNSSDTYYGPFPTVETAEAQGRRLDTLQACTGWTVGLLQEPV